MKVINNKFIFRYVCLYCDFTSDNYEIVESHIEGYHEVFIVKPIDTQNSESGN